MPESQVKAKTPWFIQHVMNPVFRVTGGFPVLSFRGPRSGKLYRTPINVVELHGARYLVSPRGETSWSRSLRATGEAWLKIHGHESHYRASEVPPAERAPIIHGYLAKWGSQTRAQFEALPDPLDHPIFRLDPLN